MTLLTEEQKRIADMLAEADVFASNYAHVSPNMSGLVKRLASALRAERAAAYLLSGLDPVDLEYAKLAAAFARDVSDTPTLTEREAWLVRLIAELRVR